MSHTIDGLTTCQELTLPNGLNWNFFAHTDFINNQSYIDVLTVHVCVIVNSSLLDFFVAAF